MYSLDCNYYTKEFSTIDELLGDVITNGMDPNYEITCNGQPTGEMARGQVETLALFLVLDSGNLV